MNIELGLRHTVKESFFKKSIAKICKSPGDTLIIYSGYFIDNENVYTSYPNNFNCFDNLKDSKTIKIEIFGGQYSLKKDDLNDESKKSQDATKIKSNMEIFKKHLVRTLNIPEDNITCTFTPNTHAKLMLKINDGFLSSLLIGSSNLTKPSFIEGERLSYFYIEGDLLITNIDKSEAHKINIDHLPSELAKKLYGRYVAPPPTEENIPIYLENKFLTCSKKTISTQKKFLTGLVLGILALLLINLL